MLSVWNKWGKMLAVTVVEIQDNVVVQTKSLDKEGFYALQVGAGWQKEKRVGHATRQHFLTRGLEVKRDLREFKVSADAMLPVGTRLLARHFVPGQFVDVQGTSRGKGFAGVMKRHGFKGGNASHGATKSHRAPGAIGGGTNSNSGGKVVKGKKMPGRMGNKTVSVQNMRVYKVDPARNLVYLLGCCPGVVGGLLRVQDAIKGIGLEGQEQPPFPTFFPTEDEVRAPPAQGLPEEAGLTCQRRTHQPKDAELVMDFGDKDPYDYVEK